MRFWDGFSQVITSIGRAWRVTWGDAAPPIDSATSDAGVTVTHDKALTLSAVWACVGLYADVVSTLPVGMYRNQAGKRSAAPEHPVHELIHSSPNANMTAVDFWKMQVSSVLLWGNGYSRKLYTGENLTAIEPWLPQFVTPYLGDRGLVRYRYDDGKQRLDVSADEVMHIKGMTLDGLVGLSPLSYARHSLGRALATEEAAGKTFQNGLTKRAVFKLDRILKEDQREQFRAKLEAFQGAANAGKPFLLEAGMSVDSLTMNPEDAEMLASREFSVEDVCRWFYRMPPQLIGHTSKANSWASSLENTNLGFLAYSMRPILVGIEQSIWKSLLKPEERREYFAKYRLEGLLRADTAARSALYASGSQNGWLLRDEIRELEDRDPIPGGNIPTAQSNLLPLDQLGKTNTGDAAKQALRAWLIGDGNETAKS